MTAAAAERRPRQRRPITSRLLIGAALAVAVLTFLAFLAGDDVVLAAHQLGQVRWAWAAVAATTGIAA